jgi:hypothetical protein
MKSDIIMIIFRSFLLGMKNVSDGRCRDNRSTQFFSIFFFRKSCLLKDKVEKFCRARQATDDNMAHVHCMLDTLGYKRTLRKCNSYCSTTTTMVAQKYLNVTLYVHCLPMSWFIAKYSRIIIVYSSNLDKVIENKILTLQNHVAIILYTKTFSIRKSEFCSHGLFAHSTCFSQYRDIIFLDSFCWLVILVEVHCVLRKVRNESLSTMQICFIFKMVNFCFYQKMIATKLKNAEQDPDLHTKYRQSKSFAN